MTPEERPMQLTEQDKFELRFASLMCEDPEVAEWLAAVADLPADTEVPCPEPPARRDAL